MIQKNEQHTILIDSLGSQGEGIGSIDGFKVFVEGALPGEKVLVLLEKVKKTYGKGRLLKILQPSPHRQAPICPVFEQCGGCQLMHMGSKQQLETKRLRVLDALKRIGKLDEVEVAPCVPAPRELHYRNKIQLPVLGSSQGMQMGLFARHSHDLVPIEQCLIHCPEGEKLFFSFKERLKTSGLLPYDPKTGKGTLRHVLIRSSFSQKNSLLLLVTTGKQAELLRSFAKTLFEEIPGLIGVVENQNQRRDNVILGSEFFVREGVGFLEEKLGPLIFQYGAASFFQVNPLQAEQLYAKVSELAQIQPSDVVLDAYCGVGTLALTVALEARSVIGMEYVEEAVQFARKNAQLNGLENTSFFAGKVENLIADASPFDIAILNPPRKGCDPAVLDVLTKRLPKRIVYVSCDPATLARDLSILSQAGYEVGKAYPFDMFPQTAHVETVVALQRHTEAT